MALGIKTCDILKPQAKSGELLGYMYSPCGIKDAEYAQIYEVNSDFLETVGVTKIIAIENIKATIEITAGSNNRYNGRGITTLYINDVSIYTLTNPTANGSEVSYSLNYDIKKGDVFKMYANAVSDCGCSHYLRIYKR